MVIALQEYQSARSETKRRIYNTSVCGCRGRRDLNEMEGTSSLPRKIMVVADPTRESAGALQWVLSHAILEHDELILLHVANASSWRNTLTTFLKRSPSVTTTSEGGSERGDKEQREQKERDLEFLAEMKNACELAQPKVKVKTERVEMEGREKAFNVLMHSRLLSIDLLVVGQRRHLPSAILRCRLSTH